MLRTTKLPWVQGGDDFYFDSLCVLSRDASPSTELAMNPL